MNQWVLLLSSECSIGWIHHNLFTHSPVDEYLGGVNFGVMMNKAAINIQVFRWIYIFISHGYISKSGLSWSYGRYMFNL